MNFCPPGTFLYSVRFGDTLWSLASFYNTTVQDIINLNPGIDPDNLVVGQELCIPLIMDKIDEYEEMDSVLSLNNELRLLWEQHIIWSHRLIMSILFDLLDEDAVTERLIRNPDDFSEVFTDYYGEDFGEMFRTLLRDHLLVGSKLIKASKEGQDISALDQEWFQNADNIARFLSMNNPFWEHNEWRELLYTHLEMLKNTVGFLLRGEYHDEVQLFDEMQMHALAMADYMVEGIMRQFPEDFED